MPLARSRSMVSLQCKQKTLEMSAGHCCFLEGVKGDNPCPPRCRGFVFGCGVIFELKGGHPTFFSWQEPAHATGEFWGHFSCIKWSRTSKSCALVQSGLSSQFFYVSCFIFIHSFIGRFDWLNHPGVIVTTIFFSKWSIRNVFIPIVFFSPLQRNIWPDLETKQHMQCALLTPLRKKDQMSCGLRQQWTTFVSVSRIHKRCTQAKWLQWCVLAQWPLNDPWLQERHNCLGGATARPIDKQTG